MGVYEIHDRSKAMIEAIEAATIEAANKLCVSFEELPGTQIDTTAIVEQELEGFDTRLCSLNEVFEDGRYAEFVKQERDEICIDFDDSLEDLLLLVVPNLVLFRSHAFRELPKDYG